MARSLTAAAFALLASPALAQISGATDRVQGLPSGLALPAFGAAAVEEPVALDTNPAGVGFVKDFSLQYFHEGGSRAGSRGDGLYLADRLGPLGIGYGLEWIRPGDGGGPRYRRQRLALTLGDGQAASLGFGWSWLASPGGALDDVSGWDVGLAVRPLRLLSESRM